MISTPAAAANARARPAPPSAILAAVRALSSKSSPPPPPPAKSPSSKPPPKSPSAKSASPSAKAPPPKPPLTALNARIVSSITTPLGARPGAQKKQQLPPDYKPVARKVTLAIVALPVAIVTSYVLWQRLVLGEERKLLVPPAPVVGEGEGGVIAKGE